MYIHKSRGEKNSMIKVLIVDDHPVVCQAVSTLLKSHSSIQVLREIYDGETAVKIAKELKPDVILLDLELPKINGFKAAKLILKQDPNIKLIAFTSHTGHYLIHTALREGFSGYLTKASAIKEIAKAIKKVYSGEHYFSEDIANRVSDKKFPLDTLSKKQYEVFSLLLQSKKVKEIADLLTLSSSTVRFHERKIYKKLKITNSKGLMLFAIKSGFFELSQASLDDKQYLT